MADREREPAFIDSSNPSYSEILINGFLPASFLPRAFSVIFDAPGHDQAA